MDFVKQTELASLSLSQCLTPWPSTTFNPKPLETQAPVNHPPQDIEAQSSPLLSPTSIFLFSTAGHLLLLCFKIIVKAFLPLWTLKLGWYCKSKFRSCSVYRTQTHTHTDSRNSELVVLGLHTNLSSMLGFDWSRLNSLRIFPVFLFLSQPLSTYSPQPFHMKTFPLHSHSLFQQHVDYVCWMCINFRKTTFTGNGRD